MSLQIVEDELEVGHTLHLMNREFSKEPLAAIKLIDANPTGQGAATKVSFMSQGDRTYWRERELIVNEPFELTLNRDFGIKVMVTVTEIRPKSGGAWRVSFRMIGIDESSYIITA